MRTVNDMRALTAEVTGEMHRLLAPLGRRIRIMEVCGTHTVAIFRAGLRQILPEEIELVSGPGCPVCVTHDAYIDAAIAYAGQEDVIITTFGDMLKVPGSTSSLAAAQAAGADVRVVYSPLDALAAAAAHPEKKIVFLAVGFETTAPTEAAAVLAAERQGLTNFFLLSAQKLVPPVMRALLDDPTAQVDGFLLPGISPRRDPARPPDARAPMRGGRGARRERLRERRAPRGKPGGARGGGSRLRTRGHRMARTRHDPRIGAQNARRIRRL